MSEAEKQLREHQQQLDADGIMVGVSRQALDETLAQLTKLQAKYDALREVGDRMAMALTYAKSGYICDYRLAWEALKEQADNEIP